MDYVLTGKAVCFKYTLALSKIRIHLPVSYIEEILSVILNKSSHILCRIAQQQADQRGDNGYSDGVDKRVHRFGVHHELAEVGKGESSVGIRKGVQHNQQ